MNFEELQNEFLKLPKEEQKKLLLTVTRRSQHSLQFIDEIIKNLNQKEKKEILLKAINPETLSLENKKIFEQMKNVNGNKTLEISEKLKKISKLLSI
jgi:alcohol dehydrogenase class IV